MFQNEVAMIATNRAYEAGAMIGQWPGQVLARCAEPTETYLTATIQNWSLGTRRGGNPEPYFLSLGAA